MQAAANGRTYAIIKYNIYFDYKFIFKTTEAKTEYIIIVVHIIDDKSKPTFNIP